MTRDQFFAWAQQQDARYEFDGHQPVAMTGGNRNHSQMCQNLYVALGTRLRGTGCRPLGPDAGLATTGNRVRYPDALVTCTRGPGADHLIPGVIVVFEAVSPGSGRMDRIIKVREYHAVPTIRRYVILEHRSIGAMVMSRPDGEADWNAATLVGGDAVDLPELGISLLLDELYEDTDLAVAQG